MSRRVIKNLPETVAGIPGTGPQELKEESNPFTSRDPRMLTYAWTGLMVRLFLIAGGVFSVWQYLEQREESRVERTLSLVQLWEQPSYQEAQTALNDRIEALNEENAGLLGDNPSDGELAFYRDRIGLAAMSEAGGDMPLDEFEDRFGRIVYFLNRVAFCVDGNLCSASVADAYFLDYAQSFWSYFGAYIAEERKAGRPKFAEPLEGYVKRSR
jgi:hypothetical protein